jgi:hypothetical protein
MAAPDQLIPMSAEKQIKRNWKKVKSNVVNRFKNKGSKMIKWQKWYQLLLYTGRGVKDTF